MQGSHQLAQTFTRVARAFELVMRWRSSRPEMRSSPRGNSDGCRVLGRAVAVCSRACCLEVRVSAALPVSRACAEGVAADGDVPAGAPGVSPESCFMALSDRPQETRSRSSAKDQAGAERRRGGRERDTVWA